MNQRTSLVAGSLLGLLGVALGAFGAHALKAMLIESGRLDTYELAVRYQFYHAFALLVVGILQQTISGNYLKAASVFLLTGTVLFSGSLYVLCFSTSTGIALVTPFGGVLMILGWLMLALAVWNGKK